MKRLLFTVLLATLALSGLAPSTAQTADAIRVGAGPDDQSLPLVYGVKSGIYKKYGLNVQLVKLAGAAAVAAALAGGSLDVGKGATVSVITAISRGLPFTIIGSLGYYNAANPNIALVVWNDANIRVPSDLNGKTFAAVSLQDQGSVFTQAWFDQHGVDRSSIKYVEIPASASLAAMEKGQIVGSTLYEPYLSIALTSGKVHMLGYPYDAVAKRYPDTMLFANRRWIFDHRDVVDRFLRATRDADTYLGAHESESPGLMAEFIGADPATIANFKHEERNVIVTPAGLQPIIDTMVKYKVIPKPISADSLICGCALL